MTPTESEVRARLDALADAIRNLELEAILAFYSPDIRAFDCHTLMQMQGLVEYRAHWESCLPHMRGPMTFDILQLDVEAGGDMAFCHYLVNCGCTGTDGEYHGGVLRATACFRKVDGEWVVVHDHISAPFDPETGMTMFGADAEATEPAGAA